jgi:very-short-patch-repair endonuclease
VDRGGLEALACVDPITSLQQPPGTASRATSAASDVADVARRVWLLGSRNTMIVTGTVEQRIAAVTRRQHGRISRDQLRAAGLTDGQIQRRVKRGVLLHEHPSVYVDGLMPEADLGPHAGALLSARPGALISHLTAAALWGLAAARGEIDVLVTGGWMRPRAGVTVHRTHGLGPGEARTREGLPVTSPARTLADCAAMPGIDPERMFTEALTLRLLSDVDLADLAAHGGAVRRLVAAETETAQVRSDTERRLLGLIARAGLTRPLVNTPLEGFEADMYWPDCAVVVEVDSYGFHTTRWAYERDRRKDAVFRGKGIDTLRFSRRQVLDQPLLVVAQIGRALG